MGGIWVNNVRYYGHKRCPYDPQSGVFITTETCGLVHMICNAYAPSNVPEQCLRTLQVSMHPAPEWGTAPCQFGCQADGVEVVAPSTTNSPTLLSRSSTTHTTHTAILVLLIIIVVLLVCGLVGCYHTRGKIETEIQFANEYQRMAM